MKPINAIISTVIVLLVMVVVALIVGWAVGRGSFLLFGKYMLIVTLVVSCLPLIAVVTFTCWTKIKKRIIK